MQQNFNVHDWYYLRKIHKKENNYFLNKAGQKGSSGGGWLSHHTKSSSSNCAADEEVKFNHSNSNYRNTNSDRSKNNKLKRHKTESTSELSSPKTTGSIPFKMIDEEHLSQEEEHSPTMEIQRNFMKLGPI